MSSLKCPPVDLRKSKDSSGIYSSNTFREESQEELNNNKYESNDIKLKDEISFDLSFYKSLIFYFLSS